MKTVHLIKLFLVSSTLLSTHAFADTLTPADDSPSSQMMQNNNQPNLPAAAPNDTMSTQPQAPAFNNQMMPPSNTAVPVSPPANNQMMAPPANNSSMTPPSNNMMQSPVPPNSLMPPDATPSVPPSTTLPDTTVPPGAPVLPPNDTLPGAPPPPAGTVLPPPQVPMTTNGATVPNQNATPTVLPNTTDMPSSNGTPMNGLPQSHMKTLDNEIIAQLNGLPQSQMKTLDNEIIAQLKTNMATNNDLTDVHVTISSQNAVVNIAGTVNNYVEANALIIIAESVPGVKDINITKLKLANSHTALSKDAVISAKIKGSFVREKLFTETSLTPVRVITFNGVVTLIGKVSNQKQVLNAIDIAKSIDGVNKVKSEIVVTPHEGNSRKKSA